MQHPLTRNLNKWVTVLIWWSNLNKYRNTKKKKNHTHKPSDSSTLLSVQKDQPSRSPLCERILIKTNEKMMRRRGWKSCTVCCVWSLVGRKNTAWLGQHYSSPQTQSMSWSLNVSGEKKWQTRRSGRRWSKKHVCLHWVLLLPVTSIHFSSPWSEKKRKRNLFVCLCACMCVRLVIPTRGFVFFLHYLSSLSSEQFYFQPII